MGVPDSEVRRLQSLADGSFEVLSDPEHEVEAANTALAELAEVLTTVFIGIYTQLGEIADAVQRSKRHG